MENREKQLKSLNKIIRKGRVKYSLHMALAMTTGFGIAKIFSGGFANWLFFEAFVSFILVFIMSCFFMWPRHINKVNTMFSELDGDEIASPTDHKSIGSWFAVFIIGFVLAAPSLFNHQLAQWLVKQQEEAITEIEIRYEDGTSVKLNIPQLYIIKEHNKEIVPGFFESQGNKLTLTATLNDMKPLPFAAVNYTSAERYKQTPQTDPNIIAIQMENIQTELNKQFINDFYNKITKDYPDSITQRTEMGLNITSAKIKLPGTNGNADIIENVDLGIPINPTMQNII